MNDYDNLNSMPTMKDSSEFGARSSEMEDSSEFGARSSEVKGSSEDGVQSKESKDSSEFGARSSESVCDRTAKSLSQFDIDKDETIGPKRRVRREGFTAGDKIMNRYTVISELGRGGMGVVYKCLDETGGVEVAVKALPPEVSHDTQEMEDIKENYQLVQALHHSNIADIKTLEKDSDTGDYYLVMECAEGENLRSYIRKRRKEGEITIESVLPILRQIASALDYAHNERIVHRDIKPANIMLSHDGRVKVLDFGLAAQIHSSMTRVSRNHYGTSGTGAYMAPEQWEGQKQDAAADQYAFAVMVYEMLAGNLPFDGTDTSILREAVLKSNAKAIAGVPKYVNEALARAMSKDANERFVTCSDFVDALGGKKVKAAKSGKKGWVVAAIIAIIVAIIAATSSEFSDSSEFGVRSSEFGARSSEFNDSSEFGARSSELEGSSEYGVQSKESMVASDAEEEASKRKAEEEAAKIAAQKAEEQKAKDTQDAYEKLGKIEVLYNGVIAKNYSRENGFGAHIDKMMGAMNSAKNAMDDKEYSFALGFIKTVQEEIDWINKNAPLRDECIELMPHVKNAKKESEELEAKNLAAVLYNEAESKLKDAAKQVAATDFASAVTSLESAKEKYEAATVKAKGIKIDQLKLQITQAVKNARFNDARSHAESLRTYNANEADSQLAMIEKKEKEKKVADAIAEAERHKAVKDYQSMLDAAEAALALDSTNAKAKKLKKDAQANLVPDRMTARLPNNEEIKLVKIPKGSFIMGSPASEPGRYNDEVQHQVTLTRDFCMGVTEVTYGQWKALMGTTLQDQVRKTLNDDTLYPELGNKTWREFYNATRDTDPNTKIGPEDDSIPMHFVSWNEANEFCRRLTEREHKAGRLPEGFVYRLPTEAEWEYACRAGSTTALYNGDITIVGERNAPALDEIAWYGGNSSVGYEGTGWDTENWKEKQYPGGYAAMRKVGTKKPNSFGLYDMIGNVWEWCEDRYGAYDNGAVIDPKGSVSGALRVVRGGCWYYFARHCRSAVRDRHAPSIRFNNFGFRVVCSAEL